MTTHMLTTNAAVRIAERTRGAAGMVSGGRLRFYDSHGQEIGSTMVDDGGMVSRNAVDRILEIGQEPESE
jgi:hypothetical protein